MGGSWEAWWRVMRRGQDLRSRSTTWVVCRVVGLGRGVPAAVPISSRRRCSEMVRQSAARGAAPPEDSGESLRSVSGVGIGGSRGSARLVGGDAATASGKKSHVSEQARHLPHMGRRRSQRLLATVPFIEYANLSRHRSIKRPWRGYPRLHSHMIWADNLDQYAFLQVLASDPENTVCGLVRNSRATRDRLAADQISSVHLLEADITDEHAQKRAAEDARHIFGNRGFDALINNAAYVSEVTALKSLQDLQMVPLAFLAFIIAFTDEPFSVFSEHDLKPIIQDAQRSFDINVFGVLKTIIAFLPLVRESSLKKVVVISSGMGDIGELKSVWSF
ncbi:hypothetical protein MPH_02747 [Macrophomina phaseolina MS6]|uniref:Short-chain dehydrogenase/reductase SDR n=1 Tax=Macrophomina phaseolina (strain MS6) TaxID=1126212 RepID=K2SBZ8_MACPH|nr:hypothetical protein MPH_02747 [Macrophomina phaseolina MS6]